MGSWSASILGNDFTEDLLPEFKAVFHKYDDKTALALLDKYEAKYISEDEKFDYIYALALFLWQKGRLTDEIKTRALEAIKADKLTAYEEAGKDVLAKRKRVLSELSLKLQSPQPERKKLRRFGILRFVRSGIL